MLMAAMLLYPTFASTSGKKSGKSASVKIGSLRLKKIKKTYNKKGVRIQLYEGRMNSKDGGKAKYYAAHVVLKPSAYGKMHIAKAKGKRSKGFQTVKEMVKTKNNKAYKAVLAVNGPFNGKDSNRWNAFNDGKRYRVAYHNYKEIYCYKYSGGNLGSNCVTGDATYSAKTGLFRPGDEQKKVTKGMTWKEAASKKLISDTFHGDMGITLLYDGKILGRKKQNAFAQRTFIGTNGNPGDFWIVVSNGRYSDKYSKGLNMYGEGKILRQLGCVYGYNLDGGGSSTMVYLGKNINKQKAYRRCYDALYIGR